MDIMQMRRGMGASGSPLPYDFEVEYLTATGSSYAQIPVKYVSNTDVVNFSYSVFDTSAMRILGGRSGTANHYKRAFVVSDSTDGICYIDVMNGSSIRMSKSMSGYTNKRLDFYSDSENRSLSYNGTSIASVSYDLGSWETEYDITIGTSIYGGTVQTLMLKGQIYAYIHRRNGVVIKDLVPVSLNGVGFLYDNVSGEMYGSLTSVPFECGPRVQ